MKQYTRTLLLMLGGSLAIHANAMTLNQQVSTVAIQPLSHGELALSTTATAPILKNQSKLSKAQWVEWLNTSKRRPVVKLTDKTQHLSNATFRLQSATYSAKTDTTRYVLQPLNHSAHAVAKQKQLADATLQVSHLTRTAKFPPPIDGGDGW